MESFRDFVTQLVADDDVSIVEREVDPVFELTAVMRKMQKGANRPLLFKNVKGSGYSVATNLFGLRKHIVTALGMSAETFHADLIVKEGKKKPVAVIGTGPVQEVVSIGSDIDIRRDIPQLVYSEHDAGAYITAGILIAKHPVTGVYNASWNRVQLVSDEKLRVRMMPPQHLGRYHAEAERLGQPLPCAIVIGAPPALMFSAASKVPFDVDELEVAGGWLGKPLDVVKCKTIDVVVPANAEMVIEGEVLPDVREDEGPFGEFTDSYVPVMKNHVFRIKAITRRKDVMYHAILAGGTEDLNLVGTPIQTEIYKRVSQYVPQIRDIATPGYVFGCVVSIKKQNDDQARNAVLAAMAAYSWTKVVVVVDDDVDVFDSADVLWAIQTRCCPDTGIYQMPRVPSYTREDVRHVHVGKIGIDATVPAHDKPLFERRRFPGEDSIVLKDYVNDQF